MIRAWFRASLLAFLALACLTTVTFSASNPCGGTQNYCVRDGVVYSNQYNTIGTTKTGVLRVDSGTGSVSTTLEPLFGNKTGPLISTSGTLSVPAFLSLGLGGTGASSLAAGIIQSTGSVLQTNNTLPAVTLGGGATVPVGQTLTNNGVWAGSAVLPAANIPSTLNATTVNGLTVPATDVLTNNGSYAGSAILGQAQGGTGAATCLANLLFAGPASGAAAAMGCRQMVNADFPSTLAPTINNIIAGSISPKVRLVNNPGTTNQWTLYGPNGAIISTAGTTTNGLQEAINYATTHGASLEVIGGMTTENPGGLDYGLITASTGITFPPLRTTRVVMNGVHITCTTAVTGTCMAFDSLMETEVIINGEILYQGTGNAVVFAPATAVPEDGRIAIVDSNVEIGSITAVGSTPNALVVLNPASGKIAISTFRFLELNGNGAGNATAFAAFGLEVQNPGATTAFAQNRITAQHVHGVSNAAVQVGISTTNQSLISANLWELGSLTTLGTNSNGGFNTFASNDLARIATISVEGSTTMVNGVVLHVGTANNFVTVGLIGPTTSAAVLNSSTSYNQAVIGGVSVSQQLSAVTFANLGTPSSGTLSYCSDCTIANPCAGSGTGALAKRLNGVWVCN